jgi:hypothetical protein
MKDYGRSKDISHLDETISLFFVDQKEQVHDLLVNVVVVISPFAGRELLGFSGVASRRFGILAATRRSGYARKTYPMPETLICTSSTLVYPQPAPSSSYPQQKLTQRAQGSLEL